MPQSTAVEHTATHSTVREAWINGTGTCPAVQLHDAWLPFRSDTIEKLPMCGTHMIMMLHQLQQGCVHLPHTVHHMR
jgi:hypothetical protein